MTQSATVKRIKVPADMLEIRWFGDPDVEVVMAADYDALAAQLSACQARAEEAEKALIQSHVALTNSDAEPHAIVVVALGIVGNALAALGADGGGDEDMTDAREMPRLRPWPNSRYYHDPIAYQSDRAEAAIARLRVAVEALGFIHINAESDSTDGRATSEHAREALSTIGEVPSA